MSAESEDEAPHPRATTALFGHAAAEQALLEAYRSGHMPHAWLIGGERGIGKATLAYRMARFVLAHPDPGAADVSAANSLFVDADHPVARRIAGRAHSDLLVLERTLNEKGRLRQDIAVDDVRRAIPFFGSTAGEGGWRIAIVDSLDELNDAGANALLKIVEEPPPRALLLLVSHAPGRALSTIRSRCRRLTLRPLSTEDVARAAATALDTSPDEPNLREAAEAADGSVARALMFLSGEALAMRQEVLRLLDRLPQLDARALHSLGDKLSGTEPTTLAAFMDTVDGWLSARLAGRNLPDMAALAQAFAAVHQSASDVDEYNLERKPFVFGVFNRLAEAMRA